MGDVLRGFRACMAGFRLLFDHRALLLWSLLPATLYLLLFAGGSYITLTYMGGWVSDTMNWILPAAADTATDGFLATVWQSIKGAGVWLMRFIGSALIALTYTSLLFLTLFLGGNIISAPLYDWLSEQTERVLGQQQELPFSFRALIRGIGTSVKVEVQKGALLLGIPLAASFVALIPVIGVPLNVVIMTVTIAVAFSYTFFDLVMARREYTTAERYAFCRRHWRQLFGFGLFFYIPVLNFVATPAFVVAATQFFCELEQDEAERLRNDAATND